MFGLSPEMTAAVIAGALVVAFIAWKMFGSKKSSGGGGAAKPSGPKKKRH